MNADSRFKLRPMRYLVVGVGTFAIGAAVAMLFRVTAAERGPGQEAAGVCLVAVALFSSGYYLAFFHVDVDTAEVYQYRYFGLGNRQVPLHSLTCVRLREGRNFFGATIRQYRIEWPGGLIQLGSGAYWPSDLRCLIRQLAEGGVPIRKGVVRALRLDDEGTLRWWE